MLVWWLHLIAALALGLFLLIRGLRGRSIGDEPRCRRCAYNLTGLESDRCPECGVVLTDRTRVRGLRRRRWVSLIAGILVLIFCVCREDVVRYVHRTNWVQYYPFSKVLHDAKADRLVALDELERRVSKGLVTGVQAYAVVEAAIEKDKPEARHEKLRFWRGFYRTLEAEGRVTDEQRERIFPRFARPTMTVRPVIRQGDPLVIEIDYQSDRSFVFSGYRFWDEPMEIRVGGDTIHVADGEGWRKRDADWRRSDSSVAIPKLVQFETDKLPPGHQTVEYTGRHVFQYWRFHRAIAPPCWSNDMHLTGEVEILPADAPDPVKWVMDPSLEEGILGVLDVCVDGACSSEKEHSRAVALRNEDGYEHMSVSVRCDGSINVPIAFELIVQTERRELPTQTSSTRSWWSMTSRSVLAWDRDEGSEWYMQARAIVPTFEEDKMYVILRASQDVARQTVDLYEIWKGELLFGPFKVEHVNPQNDAGSDAP